MINLNYNVVYHVILNFNSRVGNGHDGMELLIRAGALEQSSSHPLAQAIVSEVAKRGLKLPVPAQFEIV